MECGEIPITTEHSNRKNNEITLDDVRSWFGSYLSREFQMPKSTIDFDAPLENFKLQSFAIAAIAAEMSEWLGWAVPPEIFLEYPTLNAIGEYLVEEDKKVDIPDVHEVVHRKSALGVLLQSPPTFFYIGAIGSSDYQRPLARAIGCLFYGMQSPGYDGSEEPVNRVELLAKRYREEIFEIQPKGPYLLGGHSYSGLVAYEIGLQLRARGEEVKRVILFDTYLPVSGQISPPFDEESAIEELLTMHRLMFSGRGDSKDDVSLSFGKQDESVWRDWLDLRMNNNADLEEQVANVLVVYQANLEAIVNYQPIASDLPMVLLKAKEGFPLVLKGNREIRFHNDASANGWDSLRMRNLLVKRVPGNHFSMFNDHNLAVVADEVRRLLYD